MKLLRLQAFRWIYMLVERLPEWLKDDPHFKIYQDEIDSTELRYYYDLLRSYVPQPIQVWVDAEFPEVGQPIYHRKLRLRGPRTKPLKKVQIFDRFDQLLFEKEYSKYDVTYNDFIVSTYTPPIQQCAAGDHLFDIKTDMSQVTHVYEGDYDSDMTFYVVVQYHGFETAIKVGFPQSETPPEPHFAINDKLDIIAKGMGMRRRRYKEDNEDLLNAYPPGYPYPIEQDYWFEKRLLSEYVVADEPTYSHDIYDANDIKLMTLECKDPYPKRASIVTCLNSETGDNLLSENQSGVETDLTGFGAWSPNDRITLSRDTSVYYSGEASLKASFTDYDIDGEGIFGPSGVACIPGRVYRGAMRIKGSGWNVSARLSFWDSGDNYISEIRSDPFTPRGEWYPEDGEWYLVEIEGEAPYDAYKVKIDVIVTPVPGDYYWYDEGSIVEVPLQTVSTTVYEVNGIIITEDYAGYSIEDIASDINQNSDIFLATPYAEGIMEDNFGELNVNGLLQRYGILKSEIYAHYGVIPTIRNLDEYLLKWDIDKWNDFKWWGGIPTVAGRIDEADILFVQNINSLSGAIVATKSMIYPIVVSDEDNSILGKAQDEEELTVLVSDGLLNNSTLILSEAKPPISEPPNGLLPGNFFIDIPYHEIPSNFIWPSKIELQGIVDKCKVFGTRGTPRFTVDESITCESFIENSPIAIGVDEELEFAGNVNATSDLIDMQQQSTISYSIDETCTTNLSQQATISRKIATIIDALDLDLDEDFGLISRQYMNLTSNRLEIYSDTHDVATMCQQSWNHTADYPHTNHFSWSVVLGKDNAGIATAKNTLSVWGFPNWLCCDFDQYSELVRIPNDAIITGFMWSGAVEQPHTGGGINNRVRLYIGGIGNSTEKSWAHAGGYRQYTQGGDGDMWGYTAGTVKGSHIKSNLQAMVTVGGIAPGNTAKCDYSNLQIFYEYGGAHFVTDVITATAVSSPAVGKWGTLSQTLTEPLPSGSSIKYDVLKDSLIGGYSTVPNMSWECGTQAIPYIAQSVQPGENSLISGVKVYIHSKVGTPTDSLRIYWTADYEGSSYYWLHGTTIDLNKISSLPAVAYIPFAANEVRNLRYWLLFSRTGSLDSNNYYRVGGRTDGPGGARYWNNSIWRNNNPGDTLYHLLYKPTYLATNITADYDMENISYEDVKIHGYMSRTDTTYTPKLDKLVLKRKEVIE